MTKLDTARQERLRQLVLAAKQESAFYRRKWAELDPVALDPTCLLESLPFTTREEISTCDPFDLLWQSRREVQGYYESSGTTGQPTPGFPDLSFEKAVSFGRFLDGWMKLTQHRIKRAIVALAFELNPTGIRFQMALPTLGIVVLPVGTRSTICPPERQLALIQRLKPQAIFGRPLEILRLADALRELGGDPTSTDVSKIFFTGEIVSNAKRARLSDSWGGAEVFGHYGLTEIDSGLQSCEEGRYHEPQTPFLLTELVEENGSAAVPPGVYGELVLTSLRVEAIPLFRYRTRDIAVRHADVCPCGTRSPSYTVLGRKTDRLMQGARAVFPLEIENVVLANASIGNEYQFVLHGDELHLLLELAFGCATNRELLAQTLHEAVHRATGVEARISVLPHGALADKLGIAKQKAGAFLRAPRDDRDLVPLGVNCVDREALRTSNGHPLSI